MHQRKAEDASSAQELLQQAVEEMDSLVNAAESFSAEPIDNAITALEGLVAPLQQANAGGASVSAADSNETVAGDSLNATDVHGVDAYKDTAGYGPWLKKENDETVKHDENLASSDGLVLDERTAADTSDVDYDARLFKDTYNYIDSVIKAIQGMPENQWTVEQKELINKFKSPDAVRLFKDTLMRPDSDTGYTAVGELSEEQYAELAQNVNRMRYISEWNLTKEQLEEKEKYIAQWNSLISNGLIKHPEKLLSENKYNPAGDNSDSADEGTKTWLRKVDVSRVVDASPSMQAAISDSVSELTNYLRKNYIQPIKSSAIPSETRIVNAADSETYASYSAKIKQYLEKSVNEFVNAKTKELGRALFFNEYLQLVRTAFSGSQNIKDFIESVASTSEIASDDSLKQLLNNESFLSAIEKLVVSEIGTNAFNSESGPLANFHLKESTEHADAYGVIWHDSVAAGEAIPVYKTTAGIDVVSPEGNTDIEQYYKSIAYSEDRLQSAYSDSIAPLKTIKDKVAQWNNKFNRLEGELTKSGGALQEFAGDETIRLAFFAPGIQRPFVEAARAELETAIKLLKQGHEATVQLTSAIKEGASSVPSLAELVTGSMIDESEKISLIEDFVEGVGKDKHGNREIPMPYDQESKTFIVSDDLYSKLTRFVDKKIKTFSIASERLRAEIDAWLEKNTKNIENRVEELQDIVDNIKTSTTSIESIYKDITKSAPVEEMVVRSAATGLLYRIMTKAHTPAGMISAIQDTKDALRRHISSKEKELAKKEKLIPDQKKRYAEYKEILDSATKAVDEYDKKSETLPKDELEKFIEETKETYADPAIAKNEFYKKQYNEYMLLVEDAAAAQKNLDYIEKNVMHLEGSIAVLLENISDVKSELALFTDTASKYIAIYEQLVELFGSSTFSVPPAKLLKEYPAYDQADKVLYNLKRAIIALDTEADQYQEDDELFKQNRNKKEQLLSKIQDLLPIYYSLQDAARAQVLGGQDNADQADELLHALNGKDGADSTVRDAIKHAIDAIESPSNEYIPTSSEEESAESELLRDDDAAEARIDDASRNTEDATGVEQQASDRKESRLRMRSANDRIWLSVNAALPITPTLKEIQKLIELAKDMIFPRIDGTAIATILSNHGAFQQDIGLTSFLVNDTLAALDNAGIAVANRNILEQALWYGEDTND